MAQPLVSWERAKNVMPGGVSSPVRAFGAVGGDPVIIASGRGSRVFDESGGEFIDLLGSWGPLILGHAHPKVVEAVKKAAEKGTSFGAPTDGEVRLAEMITGALPSVEMVRFVSSGTEATMSALRLARAATGRTKVVKFAGGYHGHVDSLLVSAGSGVATLGLPDSPGVTDATSKDTIVAGYNSIDSVKEAFSSFPDQIAAVIVEPIAANMGVVPPVSGFLEGLRQICDEDRSILIFDEVVTGFRVGYSGAQGMFGISPDLTVMGKVIGGGLPIGAYGGRRELMEMVAPAGPVYQAGTLSGNPLSVAAGLAALEQLGNGDPYGTLDSLGRLLSDGLQAEAKNAGVPLTVQRVGSMMTAFFTDMEVFDLEGAKTSDTDGFARFFHQLLDGGVYWPPSQFEAAFVCLAHDDDDIARVIETASKAFERIG
ncbi:MAG: glutamate-1-semialdehyde 2,1-aminomutase [Actinobacteria bacterium]|nr:glutamate-1-semialdehyde 2,1-aminomutase [Actinomycetota bacterium]